MSRRLQLGREVITACLSMNRSGLNQGKSGNISHRFKQGCLITPSGMDYDQLAPEDVVYVDRQGNAEGDWLPSSEWRMHADIYARVRKARAVVHAHPPHCTALACLNRGIPAFHYMVAVAGGTDIRCADYATFGTEQLSRNMLLALKNRSACLLANHGLIAYGDTLKQALWRAAEVEALAQQYLLALSVGQPQILDESAMQEVIERFKTYGKQTVS